MKKFYITMTTLIIILLALIIYCRVKLEAKEIVTPFVGWMNEEYNPSICEEKLQELEDNLLEVEDIELLAKLLTLEVGDRSEDCIYYCASVVVNRMYSDNFPSDLKGVIFQKGQYSTARRIAACEYYDICFEIAEDVLANGPVIPSHILYQHYKVPVKNTTIYKVIDNEVYSY